MGKSFSVKEMFHKKIYSRGGRNEIDLVAFMNESGEKIVGFQPSGDFYFFEEDVDEIIKLLEEVKSARLYQSSVLK